MNSFGPSPVLNLIEDLPGWTAREVYKTGQQFHIDALLAAVFATWSDQP